MRNEVMNYKHFNTSQARNNMDTTTSQGRERRLAEINGEKVERLMKLHDKTGDKKYLWILQEKFGMDCDYIVQIDDDFCDRTHKSEIIK